MRMSSLTHVYAAYVVDPLAAAPTRQSTTYSFHAPITREREQPSLTEAVTFEFLHATTMVTDRS